MTSISQGDVIKINGFGNKLFVVISKNAFIQATKVFHVSPIIKDVPNGPLHIPVVGKNNTSGIVICEQLKLIDPSARNCNRVDSLHYGDIMNISDAIQGIFEYD